MKKLHNSPIARSFAVTLATLAIATPAIASQETQIVRQNTEVNRNVSMTLAEGIHLYGESVNPNEIGKSYAILEVKAGQITGAFYQPRSSFDCFRGATKESQLALNITDSYTGETYPYAIALENTSLVASVGDISTNKPGLEGFHPIENISDRDRELLQTCQAQ